MTNKSSRHNFTAAPGLALRKLIKGLNLLNFKNRKTNKLEKKLNQKYN